MATDSGQELKRLDLQAFREETRDWLAEHCPASMRQKISPSEAVSGGNKRRSSNPQAYVWLERMAARGWTVPTWPKEYGGAGLDTESFKVLLEELQRIDARPPLGGMGVNMLGPTLLEYGTPEQKRRFLPPIARGEVAWCQGYSEPGAGSDLASLQTSAEDAGDHWLINGSKIWTSGATHADWMFVLVRTDRDAPKHQGISFLLLSMDSPGVSVKPITLIDGKAPFCQTFFDDVKVPKDQLVHRVNEGWGVAKRLLQHERSGLAALAAADSMGPMERIKPECSLPELAQRYAAPEPVDPVVRAEVTAMEMRKRAFFLTQRRALEQSQAGTPGAETSIFNYIEAEFVKAQLDLQLRLRGTRGVGWAGIGFSEQELDMGRLWLEARAISIAGGSNEVQLNIIAKRVLGLPD